MRFKDGAHYDALAPGATAQFALQGGAYAMAARSAAWGGGSAVLQVLLPDGQTWAAANSTATLSADGQTDAFALPAGYYRVNVTTATGVYVTVSRVPGE